MTLMDKRLTWTANSHRIILFVHSHNHSSNFLASGPLLPSTYPIPTFLFKYVTFYASISPLSFFALDPTTWYSYFSSHPNTSPRKISSGSSGCDEE